MKSYRNILLVILILNINLISFAYIPPFTNINTFNNAKEIHFSFGFGTNGPEQSFSVAIKKDLYTFINSTFSIDTMLIHNFYSKHYFIEGGLGTIKPIGEYWRIITTGGYAYGQFYSKINEDDNDFSFFYYSNKHDGINYLAHRFFVAMNFGCEFEHLEFYFGGKITVGDYISTNLKKKKHLYGAPSLEPNLTAKLGIKQFKIIAQLRQSFDTFSNNAETIFNQPFQNSFVFFGIELTLNNHSK
jgi:hypothetical protein